MMMTTTVAGLGVGIVLRLDLDSADTRVLYACLESWQSSSSTATSRFVSFHGTRFSTTCI
jgi:hypothetical protein